MLIAQYKGELYNVDKKGEEIEIFIKGKKDGFQYREDRKGIISYKSLHKNELESLYTVKYYTVWNGERYEFDYMEENEKICLWKFSMSDEFVKTDNFTMIARGEYVKEVALEECEHFLMLLEDYYSQEKKEIVLSRMDFFALYKQL